MEYGHRELVKAQKILALYPQHSDLSKIVSDDWQWHQRGIITKVIQDKMDTVSAHVVPLTFPS